MSDERRGFIIDCSLCHQPLDEFGGLMFGPGYEDDMVRRFDVCRSCWSALDMDGDLFSRIRLELTAFRAEVDRLREALRFMREMHPEDGGTYHGDMADMALANEVLEK